MDNSLILCGGTGAHAGVAFLRLHTLGFALGVFDRGQDAFNFPNLYLVDQDAGDGRGDAPTAAEMAARLLDLHPGRLDWAATTGRTERPQVIKVTPLPIGPNQQWYRPPHDTMKTRFEGSPLLPVLFSERQQRVAFSKGMMGSPAVGALLFRMKDLDEREVGLNHDEVFGQIFKSPGRQVVVGSGVGGTGASVGPTIATRLAERGQRQVMAVMVLNWFEFDEALVDEEKRERAALRNRMMRENANSALEFYGQDLARKVAAVPVGMPQRSLILRQFTADANQPIEESFIHAVAALSAYRHYRDPAGPGLYIMGAVEPGRLDGATAIPGGGTLQSLANRAATLADLLEVWRRVLLHPQDGRVIPAVYEVVAAAADPAQAAQKLGEEIHHYREQLHWLNDVLGVDGVPSRDFSRERTIRQRLVDPSTTLSLREKMAPEEVALRLFQWAGRWIREAASPANGLVAQPGPVNGGHWPDLRNEAINIAARTNGDLTRIADQDIAVVVEAFVDPQRLSANGWPHPLAAATYFSHAIDRRDRISTRQLELLLAGLVTGLFKLRRLETPTSADSLSLETILSEYRRAGYRALAEFAVVYPEHGDRCIGFTSPHTLLCPVPFMDDAADRRLWQDIWERLSGARDGAPWSEVPPDRPWLENDLAVRQIRAWVEHEKRAQGGGSAPSWTRIFEVYPVTGPGAAFGAGASVTVFWGSSTAVERPLVQVSLPTSTDDERWIPPPNTPVLAEEKLLEQVPGLRVLSDQAGRPLFSMVEFEVPDREGAVRGWWDEHLNLLREQGLIHIWSRANGNALTVGTLQNGVLHQTIFENSLVLDRATVTISNCTPLDQEPVPGSSTPSKKTLYPDLPIKGDFIDLVETPGGSHLMTLFREGSDLGGGWQPTVSTDAQRGRRVRWSIRLRGRSAELPVEVRLDPPADPDVEPQSHRAHWLVWPRFRTMSTGGWRAYYVYDWCSDTRLFCDVVWLEPAEEPEHLGRLHRRPSQGGRKSRPFPVSYQARAEDPRHTGGPPVALCLRNIATNEESGLYLIRLQKFGAADVELKLGVDFGTSHSVAAVKVSSGKSEQVRFVPELSAISNPDLLTLHVSEAVSHVDETEQNLGLLALGGWLPNYRRKGSAGFLPSELLLVDRPLREAQSEKVGDWIPIQDVTIAPMDLARSKGSEYLLTDFKWDAGSEYFRGREKELREQYLGLFLELVMAEVVAKHARGLPSREVSITLTYPLRSSTPQVAALRESLERVIRRTNASLGIRLVPQNGVGLFDESRAARTTRHSDSEVCVVADLGGGTLDLFVGGTTPSAASGARELPEVADSVRLGGNLILRQMALNAPQYLPQSGNWSNSDARETEARLRAWIRSDTTGGFRGLFATTAEGRARLPLGQDSVFGVEKAAEGKTARELLDRYLQVLIEYLARSLAAYLVERWYPATSRRDYGRLRISVQLRGNGWRLHYGENDYTAINQSVQERVRERVEQLWPKIVDCSYPVPAKELWEDVTQFAPRDPKVAPVLRVVGEAESPEAIKERWYTYTLADLEVARHGGRRERVPWHTRIPFPTGGSSEVQLTAISPAIPLTAATRDQRLEVSHLEADLHGRVNRILRKDAALDGAGNYRAPVAAAIWEAVFDPESKSFWPHNGGE